MENESIKKVILFVKSRLIPVMFLFKGRISKWEFIGYFFLTILLTICLSSMVPLPFVSYTVIIVFWYIRFSIGAARCHDSGKSGWYQSIPVYNFYVLLIKPSDEGDNEYGKSTHKEMKLF